MPRHRGVWRRRLRASRGDSDATARSPIASRQAAQGQQTPQRRDRPPRMRARACNRADTAPRSPVYVARDPRSAWSRDAGRSHRGFPSAGAFHTQAPGRGRGRATASRRRRRRARDRAPCLGERYRRRAPPAAARCSRTARVRYLVGKANTFCKRASGNEGCSAHASTPGRLQLDHAKRSFAAGHIDSFRFR